MIRYVIVAIVVLLSALAIAGLIAMLTGAVQPWIWFAGCAVILLARYIGGPYLERYVERRGLGRAKRA